MVEHLHGGGAVDAAQILAYSPRDAEQRKTALLGMILFIASWAMLFVPLFFIYGALRVSASEWPPLGLPILPIVLPGLNTLVLVLSSFALELGIFDLARGRRSRLVYLLSATTLLGAVFLAVQVHVAVDLLAAGLALEAGAYAAVFYGLAGIHALHVLVGVLALSCITWRAFRGVYTTPRHLSLRLWAIYWHFVGVIWVLMYVLVFVV